jgi:hypothetical protein
MYAAGAVLFMYTRNPTNRPPCRSQPGTLVLLKGLSRGDVGLLQRGEKSNRKGRNVKSQQEKKISFERGRNLLEDSRAEPK